MESVDCYNCASSGERVSLRLTNIIKMWLLLFIEGMACKGGGGGLTGVCVSVIVIG